MAHCFTDYAHSSSFLIFNDYYHWLEETLKIASNISEVNWIVKAHPTRKYYGEGDDVLKLVKKYNHGNLIYMPDQYSTTIIKEVADVIVTCKGTAGHEFACFGIPAVIAGKACYSGFGFTIEPKSVNEYRKVLKNIGNIKKLEEDQIDIAIKTFYCHLMAIKYNYVDKFDKNITENALWAMQVASYDAFKKEDPQMTSLDISLEENKVNDSMLSTLISQFQKNNIWQKNNYYLKGFEFATSNSEGVK